MTKNEALKLALDTLTSYRTVIKKYGYAFEKGEVSITAIKDVLAQPEQEPLEYWNAVEGWVKIDEVRQHFETVSCGTIYKTGGEGRVPLYTTPPKREWVGLTEMDIRNIFPHASYPLFLKTVSAIEAKLKELNHEV